MNGRRQRWPIRRRHDTGDRGRDASLAEALVRRVLDVGIDGARGLDSAPRIAQDALRRHRDPERAIDAVIAMHRRMILAGGFVTGLGGFVTMPAALPANVVEFYVVTARMAAAVAVMRGYDVDDPAVRTAVLLALVEGDPEPVLRRVGAAGSGRLMATGAHALPPATRMMLHKAIGFRLVRQVGERTLAGLGRAVPLAGGVVGAGVDGYLYAHIAATARRRFPRRRAET